MPNKINLRKGASRFARSKFKRRWRVVMATLNVGDAVWIGGEKMAASHRFPFPGEASWRQRP
jgi:hypothetical protein